MNVFIITEQSETGSFPMKYHTLLRKVEVYVLYFYHIKGGSSCKIITILHPPTIPSIDRFLNTLILIKDFSPFYYRLLQAWPLAHSYSTDHSIHLIQPHIQYHPHTHYQSQHPIHPRLAMVGIHHFHSP